MSKYNNCNCVIRYKISAEHKLPQALSHES